MATAVVSAVETIIGLIESILNIRDMLAGNAPTVITISDLESVVRGEHARFFTTIAFADIRTIRDQFYNVWLPSIANRNTITANDISQPNGPLFLIFQSLFSSRNDLAQILNRLRDVFRQYHSDLHPDELMRGIFSFMHGFGLLIHMHAVYAELRRIQIGATTLEDPNLIADTRSVIQFTVDSDAAMSALVAQDLYVSRVILIGQVHRPFFEPWQWTDTYSPLLSTAFDTVLNDSGTQSSGSGNSPEGARVSRDARIQGVNGRVRTVAIIPANTVTARYATLRNNMRERERRQGGSPAVIRPTPSRGVPPHPAHRLAEVHEDTEVKVETPTTSLGPTPIDGANAKPEVLEKELSEEEAFFDINAVPVGAEEFIAFSKALLSAHGGGA